MDELQKTIYNAALEEEEGVKQVRRHLHQHPELSFQEEKTAAYICSRLEQLGIRYQKQIGGTDGILACLGPSTAEKAVLLRADMDALPIEEQTGAPYASQNPGVMHACGHDAHTAILLGVCRVLKKLEKQLPVAVKLAFQPGEETDGGAAPMIAAGVLNDPNVLACAALHMDPDLECGKITVKNGPLYASPDEFDLTIYGAGGHGAQPHLCTDPIMIAAEVIQSLQTIVSRKTDPFLPAVVSVCSMHAGNATNIIPDTAFLSGTARAMTQDMRDFLEKEIADIVSAVCKRYGAEYDFQFRKMFPPLINDNATAKRLHASAKRYLSPDNAIWGGASTMAGEDFAYFAQAVPSALFKLGCRNEKKGIVSPLHSPKFDIDETCLKYGIMIFSDFALRYSA